MVNRIQACLVCLNQGKSGPIGCGNCGRKPVKHKESNYDYLKRQAEKRRQESIEKWQEQVETFDMDTTGSPDVDDLVFGDEEDA